MSSELFCFDSVNSLLLGFNLTFFGRRVSFFLKLWFRRDKVVRTRLSTIVEQGGFIAALLALVGLFGLRGVFGGGRTQEG